MSRFSEDAARKDNTAVLCISADLPFAQARFCGAEGIKNVVMLSTFRNPEFRNAWGVDIQDGPLAEKKNQSNESSFDIEQINIPDKQNSTNHQLQNIVALTFRKSVKEPVPILADKAPKRLASIIHPVRVPSQQGNT